MTQKGDTWNESTTHRDPYTMRTVRKVTCSGSFNFHSAYHTLSSWTTDGTRCVFASGREGCSTIFCCDARTGDITQLLDWQEGWRVGLFLAPSDRPTGIAGTCLDANSGWVYYVQNTGLHTELKAVHIDSLEERTLSEGVEGYLFGQPTVSADGQAVAVPSNIIPEPFKQRDACKPLLLNQILETFGAPGGSRMQLLRFSTAGKPTPEVLYDEMDCRGNHLQYSPVDSNVLLTDRDFAPRFMSGSDSRRNRVWVWHIAEQRMIEQPSPSGRSFQVHSTWSFDGQEVLYHCPPFATSRATDPRGYAIGVNDLEGNNIAEFNHAAWTHYGHVGAVPGRKAIMLDGNLTDDLILWMYYDDPARPRVEIICRHGTNWGGHEGQYPHPHPQCAPTGDRIIYNAAEKGRSDVFIVDL